MMLKKFNKILFATCFTLICATSSYAADSNRNWSAGLLLGAASLNQDLGTNGAAGLMIRDRFNPNFGAGLTISVTSLENYRSSGFEYTVTLSHVNFDLDYYITNSFWIGPRLGWAQMSFSAKSGAQSVTLNSDSVFDWGPAAGYDYRLSDLISIGLDVSLMVSAFEGSSISSFQYFATLKFNW